MFVDILDGNDVGLLVDVRSHPGSSRYPHFNRAALQRRLGRRYHFLGDRLGGRMDGVYAGAFPKHHIAKRRPGMKKADEQSLFPTWTNQGLYDYGVWMASQQFIGGLHDLRGLLSDKRIAIMCAEVLWWKCHRSMIADAWEACGGQVYHVWPDREPTRHVLGNRLERYEPETQAIWQDKLFKL